MYMYVYVYVSMYMYMYVYVYVIYICIYIKSYIDVCASEWGKLSMVRVGLAYFSPLCRPSASGCGSKCSHRGRACRCRGFPDKLLRRRR